MVRHAFAAPIRRITSHAGALTATHSLCWRGPRLAHWLGWGKETKKAKFYLPLLGENSRCVPAPRSSKVERVSSGGEAARRICVPIASRSTILVCSREVSRHSCTPPVNRLHVVLTVKGSDIWRGRVSYYYCCCYCVVVLGYIFMLIKCCASLGERSRICFKLLIISLLVKFEID